MRRAGPDEIQRRVGVNATGLPFNALEAVERAADGRTNPMVNPDAIATASLAPGASAGDKWEFVQAGLSRFAGRPLEWTKACTRRPRRRTTATASSRVSLADRGAIRSDPRDAVDVYTRQSCLRVT